MNYLNEIYKKLCESPFHALHVEHKTNGGKFENPAFGNGAFKKYFIHLADLSGQDFIPFFKNEARKLGNGELLVQIRKKNGTTYKQLNPSFGVLIPIQMGNASVDVQQAQTTSSNTQRPSRPTTQTAMNNTQTDQTLNAFGLSKPQLIDMYADSKDYRRLVEEREGFKTRIERLERELDAAQRKADKLENKNELQDAKHEMAIQRLEIKLENEKASYKREMDREKDEFVKGHKGPLDGLDISKLLERPEVLSILSSLATKGKTGVPGLSQPEEGLTEYQKGFIELVRSADDHMIQKLHGVYSLLDDPKFEEELNQLGIKYTQNPT